tara:strand:+ start:1460 stop:2491 length:1032 start_codon:yes stop_codon:yes gene_type:complete
MAYTTIDKSSLHFNTKLYTGNNSTNALTGVGFQPDFIWLRPRNAGDNHRLMNSVSGADKYLITNTTGAEADPGSNFVSFDSDGFTLGGSDGGWNSSSYNYVSWNWKASGSTASNSNGSITSTVSANTTAGFSLVSYTGTGSNATVGHGLGVAPKVVFIKRRSATSQWVFGHKSLGFTKFLELNLTGAAQTNSNRFNDTDPTSSVFSIGTEGDVNSSGQTYIAYCFAEKTGYSSFGTYVGNQNDDGPMVYTGFKPAWIMLKNSSDSQDWQINDNRRPGYNYNHYLLANSANAEVSADNWVDFTSNGFKLRKGQTQSNRSDDTYIYMAFAEAPLVGSNNTPAVAR